MSNCLQKEKFVGSLELKDALPHKQRAASVAGNNVCYKIVPIPTEFVKLTKLHPLPSSCVLDKFRQPDHPHQLLYRGRIPIPLLLHAQLDARSFGKFAAY